MGRFAIAAALCLAVAGPAFAAEIEITPMFGYRFGGEIDANDSPILPVDASVDESGSYGLALGIRPAGGFTIELVADRQETRFVENDQLFGGETKLFDVEVSYYHVGVGYTWRHEGWDGFLTGSLGVGHLNPDSFQARSEDEFSTSIGGGMKVWANRHVGFRFELRGYWTNIDGNDDDWWDSYSDDLFQGQARVGVVFAF